MSHAQHAPIHLAYTGAGPSVRDRLTVQQVASACGGAGMCGQCRVRVTAGKVNTPTDAELRTLSAAQLQQGLRLACQLYPQSDVWVIIANPASAAGWQTLVDESPAVFTPAPGFARTKHYGVAVDVGTTRLRVALWDLATGRRLATRGGLNPQARFGTDVLTRLAAACESQTTATAISNSVQDAITTALTDIFSREGCKEAVARLAVVGNTAMLALLAGRGYAALLDPVNWNRKIDCHPADTRAWCRAWALAETCRIELIPPLAGFVGSDLLAGVLATDLMDKKALLIDFGTNTEIALWDGHTLWVTSTPGGPAFEGSGIRCGMPAEAGAIARLTWNARDLHWETIGDARPQGICGSGLVDLAACLVQAGVLNSAGRFPRRSGLHEFPLPDTPVVLHSRDVDALQRAKAGVAAATLFLLQQAGMQAADLQRVCVAGAFGHYLHIPHAQAIGLLPAVPPQRVELYANSALAGCERWLFARNSAEIHTKLTVNAKLINLSQATAFDDLFIDNLRLRPLP